jgi:hypothetical protein
MHAIEERNCRGRNRNPIYGSIRLALSICLTFVLSSQAFAQYGGGMGGGTGAGSPGYAPPKGGYGSSGAAIGAGVGAAAGAGVLYLALHHRGVVTGCVRRTDDGLSLIDEKKNKSYSIVPGGVDLKPGQLVQLKGKKSNDGAGAESFQAKKLVKDLGACSVDSALNTVHQ